MWRVPADVLNKQPRAADKGWSCRFGVGRAANDSSNKQLVMKFLSDLDYLELPRVGSFGLDSSGSG